LHFRVSNAAYLSARIEECATDPGLWKRLCANVPQPQTIDQTVDQLLALYVKNLTAVQTTSVVNPGG
jgi:hypothetical protein